MSTKATNWYVPPDDVLQHRDWLTAAAAIVKVAVPSEPDTESATGPPPPFAAALQAPAVTFRCMELVRLAPLTDSVTAWPAIRAFPEDRVGITTPTGKAFQANSHANIYEHLESQYEKTGNKERSKMQGIRTND